MSAARMRRNEQKGASKWWLFPITPRVDRFPKVDAMLMKRLRILPVERLMNGTAYGQNIAKLG